MLFLNSLFYTFSILLVFSSILVVTARHPIFSLLFLILSFISSSFLLFALECEFLALLFMLIYVGAIAVLFLFSLMMLEFKSSDLSRNLIKYLPVGAFFGVFLFLSLAEQITTLFDNNLAINNSLYVNAYKNWQKLTDVSSDTKVYSQVLYSYFIVQLLVIGLILLIVLTGVVYLTNTFNKSIGQSVYTQLSRNSKFIFKD